MAARGRVCKASEGSPSRSEKALMMKRQIAKINREMKAKMAAKIKNKPSVFAQACPSRGPESNSKLEAQQRSMSCPPARARGIAPSRGPRRSPQVRNTQCPPGRSQTVAPQTSRTRPTSPSPVRRETGSPRGRRPFPRARSPGQPESQCATPKHPTANIPKSCLKSDVSKRTNRNVSFCPSTKKDFNGPEINQPVAATQTIGESFMKEMVEMAKSTERHIATLTNLESNIVDDLITRVKSMEQSQMDPCSHPPEPCIQKSQTRKNTSENRIIEMADQLFINIKSDTSRCARRAMLIESFNWAISMCPQNDLWEWSPAQHGLQALNSFANKLPPPRSGSNPNQVILRPGEINPLAMTVINLVPLEADSTQLCDSCNQESKTPPGAPGNGNQTSQCRPNSSQMRGRGTPRQTSPQSCQESPLAMPLPNTPGASLLQEEEMIPQTKNSTFFGTSGAADTSRCPLDTENIYAPPVSAPYIRCPVQTYEHQPLEPVGELIHISPPPRRSQTPQRPPYISPSSLVPPPQACCSEESHESAPKTKPMTIMHPIVRQVLGPVNKCLPHDYYQMPFACLIEQTIKKCVQVGQENRNCDDEESRLTKLREERNRVAAAGIPKPPPMPRSPRGVHPQRQSSFTDLIGERHRQMHRIPQAPPCPSAPGSIYPPNLKYRGSNRYWNPKYSTSDLIQRRGQEIKTQQRRKFDVPIHTCEPPPASHLYDDCPEKPKTLKSQRTQSPPCRQHSPIPTRTPSPCSPERKWSPQVFSGPQYDRNLTPPPQSPPRYKKFMQSPPIHRLPSPERPNLSPCRIFVNPHACHE